MSQINLSQITLDDALNDPNPLSFSPARAPVLTTRITCRACDRTEQVPLLSSGLLCSLCRADLDATERHIRDTLQAAEQNLHDAWTSWDADLAHASDEDREWWGKVSAAANEVVLGQRTQADYDRRRDAALKNTDHPTWGVLLRSAERAEAALKAMERTQAWADAALGGVEAARDG